MLLILNVVLIILLWIVIGILVDKFGLCYVFSGLLIVFFGFCYLFVFVDSYEILVLSCFMLGFVGVGFVIGICMVGEWFLVK